MVLSQSSKQRSSRKRSRSCKRTTTRDKTCILVCGQLFLFFLDTTLRINETFGLDELSFLINLLLYGFHFNRMSTATLLETTNN